MNSADQGQVARGGRSVTSPYASRPPRARAASHAHRVHRASGRCPWWRSGRCRKPPRALRPAVVSTTPSSPRQVTAPAPLGTLHGGRLLTTVALGLTMAALGLTMGW